MNWREKNKYKKGNIELQCMVYVEKVFEVNIVLELVIKWLFLEMGFIYIFSNMYVYINN